MRFGRCHYCLCPIQNEWANECDKCFKKYVSGPRDEQKSLEWRKTYEPPWLIKFREQLAQLMK